MDGASINLWPPLTLCAFTTDPTSMVMMGVAGAFLIYVTVVRPWLGKGKRASDPMAGSPLRLTLSQQKSLDRDMQNLLVELHDMARQMSSQIETRVAKLEILLEEADARIETLGKLNRAAEARAVEPDSRLDDRDAGAVQPPLRTGLRLASSEPSIEAPVERYSAIYLLADDGLDTRQIAQRLGRPFGEIELILALRPAQRAPIDAGPADASEPPVIASA